MTTVLSKLPNDVLRKIFLDLDYDDVFNACSVDEKLSTNVCNETFWRLYGQKKYSLAIHTLKKFGIKTWKEMVHIYKDIGLYYMASHYDEYYRDENSVGYYDTVVLPIEGHIDAIFIGTGVIIDSNNKVYVYESAYPDRVFNPDDIKDENNRIKVREAILKDKVNFVSGGWFTLLTYVYLYLIDSKGNVYVYDNSYAYSDANHGSNIFYKIPIVYENGEQFNEKISSATVNRILSHKKDVWILYRDDTRKIIFAIKENSPQFINIYSAYDRSYGIDINGKVWEKKYVFSYQYPGVPLKVRAKKPYVQLKIPTKIVSLSLGIGSDTTNDYAYMLDHKGDIWVVGRWGRFLQPISYRDYFEVKYIKHKSPVRLDWAPKFKRLMGKYAISMSGDIYYLTPELYIIKVKLYGKKMLRTTQSGDVYYLTDT